MTWYERYTADLCFHYMCLAAAQLLLIRTVKPGTHWQQSWIQHSPLCWKLTLCCFGPVHIGDKVDLIGNKVDSDKLPNSSCCQIFFQNQQQSWPYRQQSTLLPVSESRLSTKSTMLNSTCRQCVPGLKATFSGQTWSTSWWSHYQTSTKLKCLLRSRTCNSPASEWSINKAACIYGNY